MEIDVSFFITVVINIIVVLATISEIINKYIKKQKRRKKAKNNHINSKKEKYKHKKNIKNKNENLIRSNKFLGSKIDEAIEKAEYLEKFILNSKEDYENKDSNNISNTKKQVLETGNSKDIKNKKLYQDISYSEDLNIKSSNYKNYDYDIDYDKSNKFSFDDEKNNKIDLSTAIIYSEILQKPLSLR